MMQLLAKKNVRLPTEMSRIPPPHRILSDPAGLAGYDHGS